MKNFLVFAGINYYPSGGVKDFKKSFDTEREALLYVANKHGEYLDWWQIVDRDTFTIIEETKRSD